MCKHQRSVTIQHVWYSSRDKILRKDEEPYWYAPAAPHHGDQSNFSWRPAIVPLDLFQVVFVHPWRADGTHDDSQCKGNEHEACDGR